MKRQRPSAAYPSADKYADVTVKADDVDHVVVEYSYNSSYN